MHKNILSNIPQDLLNVIPQVEIKTGISVDISIISDEIKADFPLIGKSQVILDINPDQRSISILVGETEIAPHMIGHELIHLRRNIIEGCPKMFPVASNSPESIQEIFLIENDLEHFFVIREEISKFPGSEKHWISHYNTQLDRSDLSEKSVIMHWCILRTLFLEYDGNLVQRCAKRLHAFENNSLLKFANNLQIELSQAFPDKRKMIDLHSEFFPKIKDNFILGRYYTKSGNLSVEELIG